MTRSVRRGRGEDGVVLFLTVALLVPLLTVAAYTIDLSSWHARMTHLQGSADAAALAGTVWMPNMPKAASVAADTLQRNGLVHGQDGVTVEVTEGRSPTSLRVSITDHDPPRLFAFSTANPDLTRSAEADYFLPLPLGSPLNYFGGDRTKTQVPDTTSDTVTWPVPHDSTSRPPVGPFGCNVGTSSTQALGRWTNATSYSPTGFSGSTRCLWTAATATTSPNATTQVPSNVPCNRVQTPTSTMGRWNTGVLGAIPTYTGTNRHTGTSGTGNRQCTWAVAGTQPPDTATRAPANTPCMVTGNLLDGSWNEVLGLDVFLPTSLLAAPLCQWTAAITTIVVPGTNPIPVDRNPGFWAQVEGPGTVTAYGDAFSTRCTTALSCSTVQSEQHRTTGYWYVMRIPAGATEPVTLSVYDALYRRDGVITTETGDYNLGAASTTTNPDFTTEYRLYRQDDPLDVNVRSPVGAATSGNQADGSCWWAVTNEAAFDAQWRPLCTVTPEGGAAETYLLNVRTYDTGAAHGAGLNGYALQAIAPTGPQPALYAYSDMGMFNNGSGTFYLAEVAPTFAGKVLAIDLWDPGDVSTGTAVIYPKMPSAAVPRPVADAPPTCSYTASPDPNGVHAPATPPSWGSTGVRYFTPQPSDHAAKCAVNTAPAGSTQRFNDEWLHIRIQIPSDYACTPGLNPETTAGSCWWGIEYSFSAQPYDVTTWKARIEGNPVHLTA